jgi:hypothetical protein
LGEMYLGWCQVIYRESRIKGVGKLSLWKFSELLLHPLLPFHSTDGPLDHSFVISRLEEEDPSQFLSILVGMLSRI